MAHIPKKERKSEKGVVSVNVRHVEAGMVNLGIYSFQFITLYAQPTADLINERETHSFRTFCTIDLLQQERNTLWHGIIGKKSPQTRCPVLANIALGKVRLDSSPFPSSHIITHHVHQETRNAKRC